MTTEFKDTKFMTAAERAKVLRQWIRFLKSGLEFRCFTEALYHHLIQHCDFIAHYNRMGFYDVYFADPGRTSRFLDQFDRAKGGTSVEYGDWSGWLDGDYADINNAMVDAAAPLLAELRMRTRDAQIKAARDEYLAAFRRLNELQREQGSR